MPRIGQRVSTPEPLVPFWQTTDSKTVRLYSGDMLSVLPRLPSESFDSVVTDPPYDLGEPRSGMVAMKPRTDEQKASRRGGFMGKKWDGTGIAFQPETWGKVLRTLKPGGYMLCFGGTRTYHRMTCAIEDAGFEIRDCLMWLYGTGFPKGQGCLKPGYEPIVLARKPGKKVLPLGIDECRISTDENLNGGAYCTNGNRGTLNGEDRIGAAQGIFQAGKTVGKEFIQPNGRYPADVLHDGSDEVMEEFEKYGESKSKSTAGVVRSNGILKHGGTNSRPSHGTYQRKGDEEGYEDSGTVARFFYCAKASKEERGSGKDHPTVKPLELLKWCVRLVTPVGGMVLDCFAGSSMTGVATMSEGRQCVLIEKELPYAEAGSRKLENASRILLPQKRVNVLDRK
jgi:site-specific DNA-methyltransferase (adenine-specific)